MRHGQKFIKLFPQKVGNHLPEHKTSKPRSP